MKSLNIQNVSQSLTDLKRDFGRMRKREPNVLIFILYGLLFDTVVNLWKPFSIKFVERLGGGELHISLMNALPGLVAACVLLPGSVFLSRFPNKKKVTATFILVSRAMLMLIAFVPFLPASVRPMLFVVLLALMNCPDALSQTSLQSFLGSVFDGYKRGQAITLRNKFGNAVIPLVTVATGLMITYIPSTDSQRMILYQIFFVCAFFVGLIEVFVFRKFRVPSESVPDAGVAHAGLASHAAPKLDLSLFTTVLKNKKFLSFFWPVLLFMFTWQAGWPLCGIYQVDTLHANELWFAIFALASGIGGFTSAGFWQKFMRKKGNTLTLILSAFLLAGNMLFFPLCPNVFVMTLVSLYGGFAGIGINSSLLNGVLEATPDENRLTYLAFYNTIVNLSLFVAPLFSHVLLSWYGIRVALLIVFAGRVVSACVISFTRRSELTRSNS